MSSTASISEPNSSDRRVSLVELKALLETGKRVQLVDVRSHDEFDSGHIPGAINIPMQEIEARLDDIAAHNEVVLVCRSGQRAGMTCQILANKREHVAVLEGGTEAWLREGLPVVQSKSTRWSLERQVRLGAGILILISFGLAYLVSPLLLGLAIFVGAGLTFAGATNLCLMASLLAKMPWNRAKS